MYALFCLITWSSTAIKKSKHSTVVKTTDKRWHGSKENNDVKTALYINKNRRKNAARESKKWM